VVEERSGGRSVLAEAKPVSYQAYEKANARVGLPDDPATVRINQGADGKGFAWHIGRQLIQKAWAHNLAIGGGLKTEPPLQESKQETGICLAARKATHLLMLRPAAFHPALSLNELRATGGSASVEAKDAQWAGVRAAVLSASFLITAQAALEMDIDPDEFDILEPRLDMTQGMKPSPILQFADQMVNGAGYVRWLGTASGGTPPPILDIIRWLATGEGGTGRRHFRDDLFAESHGSQCRSSCYGCLQRYRNQSYHGILDWRLGLDYIAILADQNYDCGLGKQGHPPAWKIGSGEWMQRELERFTATYYAGGNIRVVDGFAVLDLPEQQRQEPRSVILRHPLWSPKHEGRLCKAIEDLQDDGRTIKTIDTFNLCRRPAKVRMWLQETFDALA
jgi:hypothetical protein